MKQLLFILLLVCSLASCTLTNREPKARIYYYGRYEHRGNGAHPNNSQFVGY